MKALLVNAMLTPWRSTRASRRWFALAVMAVFLLGAVAVGVFMPGPRRWLACAMLYAVGSFVLWALWLSATLLLAIDARRLNLPGVQRVAIQGLVCYAVLTVGLPVLALNALPGTDIGEAALIVATASVGGLAFALLPGYVVSLVCLLPALRSSLQLVLPLPNLPDLGWQDWFMTSLILASSVITLRWHQLVRNGINHVSGLRRPLVVQFHRMDATGLLDGDPESGSVQMIRQRPNWLQPRAALRNAGPRSPVLALRIALGGRYLPRTLASHVCTVAIVLLQVAAMGLVFTLALTDKHGTAFLQASLGFTALAFIGGSCLLGGPMLALMIGAQLQQRWQRTHAELPLLALLPGLGDARARRRHFLHATLGIPATALAALLVVLLAAGLAIHLRGLNLLLLALPIPASLGATVMLVLRISGGRPLPAWGAWLLLMPLTVLLVLSVTIPAMSLATHASMLVAKGWLLAAWCVMALVLAWLGQHGWHAFRQRPHPFLPNAV